MQENFSNMLSRFIPITEFNKGGAGRIFEQVKRDGAYLVVKNNKPECILLSPEEYCDLVKRASSSISPC